MHVTTDGSTASETAGSGRAPDPPRRGGLGVGGPPAVPEGIDPAVARERRADSGGDLVERRQQGLDPRGDRYMVRELGAARLAHDLPTPPTATAASWASMLRSPA